MMRDDVRADMHRIGELWTNLREQYGIPFDRALGDLDITTDTNAGYLFGHFSIADCMYAPIVNRLMTYDPTLSSLDPYPISKQYVLRLLSNSLLREWISAAKLEGSEWKIAKYESVQQILK
jgi:glutathione S-transferase